MASSARGLYSALLERGILAAADWEQFLAERGLSWKMLERGEYEYSAEDLLVVFVATCPLRWAEGYLVEPSSGDPYRFFDYQRESLAAWRQDVVHKDGAEVGKTREIIALILWAMNTSCGGTVARPSILVAAPEQVHLEDIIGSVEEQMGAQDDGSAKNSPLSRAWLKPRRTPHTEHRFRCPNLSGQDRTVIGRVYYRPGGVEGRAFRGVHVSGFILVDEAAKLKRAVHWSELWRAGLPGCRRRVYSVPDGDRATDFFRMAREAVPGLAEGTPGWRLFHWPKTLMPPPFWTEERRREFISLYGGATSSGYLRNVLGEDGQEENPVWSWDLLLGCVQAVPEFRAVALTVSRQSREMAVEVRQIGLRVEEGQKIGDVIYLEDGARSLDAFGDDQGRRDGFRGLIDTHVVGRRDGRYWIGADLGERNDPTEIFVSEEIGETWVDVLRVHALGLDYPSQCALIDAIDRAFGRRANWGVDLGSAGTAVVRDLQTLDLYAEARFEERLRGFHFQESVDCVGENGEALTRERVRDGEEEVLRAPAKHWATLCISQRLQRGGYRMAYDESGLNSMAGQTAREGAKWPLYSKNDDHVPDARRMQMLAKLHSVLEGGAVDVFFTGVHMRAA